MPNEQGRLAVTHQPRNRGASTDDVSAGARRIADALRGAGFRDVAAHDLSVAPVGAVCVTGGTDGPK